MQPEELAAYREKHRQRFLQRAAEAETKRCRILAILPAIAKLVRGLGADRLLIYGSLVQDEGRRFRLDSDIDLLVYGLPMEAWQTAFQALEDLEGLQDIAVDLKRAEEVSDDFLEYVEQAGCFVDMPGGQDTSSLRGTK